MNRKVYITVATLIALLAGCSSFNNSFNTYMPYPAKSVDEPTNQPLGEDDDTGEPAAAAPKTNLPVIEAVPQKMIIETDAGHCDTSPYPAPGHPPELPLKALQAAPDVYAVERLERKHIDELRAYIYERRRLQKEAREAFSQKCKVVKK